MKKLYAIIIALLLATSILAQSPEKMSYQAVIRNSSDELVTNQTVGVQISILQGTADGSAVYIETQTPTTNANGLVSIEIGGNNATVVSGDFTTIDWANSIYKGLEERRRNEKVNSRWKSCSISKSRFWGGLVYMEQLSSRVSV